MPASFGSSDSKGEENQESLPRFSLDEKNSDIMEDKENKNEKDVAYFRETLSGERNRLTELCKKWKEIMVESNVNEEIAGDIRTTIGQAELLMNQRFHQFSGLIDACEYNTGEKKTTCTDLEGFWEMIYSQVVDVDNRFKSLKELQENGWKSKETQKTRKVQRKPSEKIKRTKNGADFSKVQSKFAEFRKQKQKEKKESEIMCISEEFLKPTKNALVNLGKLLKYLK